MDVMPKKFPPEFKRDVVTVARRGDLTKAEVAVDFGISIESVKRWCRQADIDDGVTDGLTTTEQSELVQLRPAQRAPACESNAAASTTKHNRDGEPQSWRGSVGGLADGGRHQRAGNSWSRHSTATCVSSAAGVANPFRVISPHPLLPCRSVHQARARTITISCRYPKFSRIATRMRRRRSRALG
jgi:transposase